MPIAVDVKPAAYALLPTATEPKLAAVAEGPMATVESADEFALLPTAIALFPVADADGPTAIAEFADAFASVPTAIASSAVADADGPTAIAPPLVAVATPPLMDVLSGRLRSVPRLDAPVSATHAFAEGMPNAARATPATIQAVTLRERFPFALVTSLAAT
jgi:hypothetical protein